MSGAEAGRRVCISISGNAGRSRAKGAAVGGVLGKVVEGVRRRKGGGLQWEQAALRKKLAQLELEVDHAEGWVRGGSKAQVLSPYQY